MRIRSFILLGVAALVGCATVNHNHEQPMWRVAHEEPGWSFVGNIDPVQDGQGRQYLLTVRINGATAISAPMLPGYDGVYNGHYEGHDVEAQCDYPHTTGKKMVSCLILIDDDPAVTLAFLEA
jgi:hypothetical protein